MSEQTQIVQNHVVEEVNAELIALLRKVPILSSLKDDELHCLEGVQEIHIDKGEIITRQGEISHFFWILLEGELRVFAEDGRATRHDDGQDRGRERLWRVGAADERSEHE